MKILSFNEFILNESFKSPTISRLFKDGEFSDDLDKGVLNQISEDDILGIVDSKEDVTKLLEDNGLEPVKKEPHMVRYFDEYENMDEYPDYSKPEEIKDRTMDYVIELKSGKYLVIRITKLSAISKFDGIRRRRQDAKKIEPSKFRKKFDARSKFVKTHNEDIKAYNDMLKFLEDNGCDVDEFIKTCCKEINDSVEDVILNGEIEDIEKSYPFHSEFDFHGYNVQLDFDCVFDYKHAEYYAGYHDVNQMSPDERPSYTYKDSKPIIKEMYIEIEDKDGKELFDVFYLPEFDKNHRIDFGDDTYEIIIEE